MKSGTHLSQGLRYGSQTWRPFIYSLLRTSLAPGPRICQGNSGSGWQTPTHTQSTMVGRRPPRCLTECVSARGGGCAHPARAACNAPKHAALHGMRYSRDHADAPSCTGADTRQRIYKHSRQQPQQPSHAWDVIKPRACRRAIVHGCPPRAVCGAARHAQRKPRACTRTVVNGRACFLLIRRFGGLSVCGS